MSNIRNPPRLGCGTSSRTLVPKQVYSASQNKYSQIINISLNILNRMLEQTSLGNFNIYLRTKPISTIIVCFRSAGVHNDNTLGLCGYYNRRLH